MYPSLHQYDRDIFHISEDKLTFMPLNGRYRKVFDVCIFYDLFYLDLLGIISETGS